MTEREDSLGFQLLISTLNNYNHRIKDLEVKEKTLRDALTITIKNTHLLKQMIDLQRERADIQSRRINMLESNQRQRYILR